ncbi:MAG TPA: hypothetical protein VFP96_17545 [Candidatus Acidoferrum sp.]|nr:hypothetical protein [Candidatus Acidoferrum sp.]
MNSVRPIVRAIRKSARAKLRLSRSAWKEYKHSRGPFYRRSFPGIQRIGQIYVLGLLVLLAQRSAHVALVVFALYSTATVLQRAHSFQRSLYNSSDLAFFMHCPVSDQEFFRHAWRSLLRSSFSIWLAAFGIFALVIVAQGMSGRFWLLAAIAAVLHWLLLLTLIFLADRFVPSRYLLRISLPFYILTFTSLFLPDSVVRSAWIPVSYLPSVWIPSFFASAALAGESSRIYLMFPILALIAFLPVLYKSARSLYPRGELQYPISLVSAEPEEAADFPPSGSFENADTIVEQSHPSRHLRPVVLAPLDWNASSWLERFVGKSLNAAEKRTAEFLLGGQLGSWSRTWFVALQIAAVGLVLLLLPVIPVWIGILVGSIATSFAVPLLGGSWLGLQLVPMFGTVRLACAGLPVSYAMASRIIAKINAIRLLSWLPVFLVYGAAAAWRVEMPLQFGLATALRIVFALLSFQPILILGKHSHGTNDSRQLNLHSVVFLLAALFIGSIYLGCAIAFLVVPYSAEEPHPVLITVLAGAMVLSSFLLWRGYGHFYDHGRLDTIRTGDR